MECPLRRSITFSTEDRVPNGLPQRLQWNGSSAFSTTGASAAGVKS